MCHRSRERISAFPGTRTVDTRGSEEEGRYQGLLWYLILLHIYRIDVFQEFYVKSRASQELIFAQIPWASAGAERSRAHKNQDSLPKGKFPSEADRLTGDDSPIELTTEEKLLAALLAANAELIEALQQHDDLERVGIERNAEDQSRRETRMDRRVSMMCISFRIDLV